MGFFLQNVLISNILHKVECVFQLDDLSLWEGRDGKSKDLSEGRRKGWWGI